MMNTRSFYKYVTALFLLLITPLFFSQQIEHIAFYNVENLFDTIDGPNDDAEFLPDSKSQWDDLKYQTKLTHIRQVMADLQMPMILGICEIENRKVLTDLIGEDKRYGIVHYESPDARGIDVAMLYRKDLLRLKTSGQIRFTLPGDTLPTSRDIVWAKYQYKKEHLYVLVNHWPSRRGGTEESAAKRLAAAQNASQFIDSIQRNEPSAKIILMGDLNDYPEDAAPQLIASKITPQITKNSGTFGGSYCYKNEWNVLDHIFISSNALSGKIQVQAQSGKIHEFPYLLTEYKGQIVPSRTYAGPKYLGGYSDHLPVSVDVILHP
jgi:predicted extracellular nuclease